MKILTSFVTLTTFLVVTAQDDAATTLPSLTGEDGSTSTSQISSDEENVSMDPNMTPQGRRMTQEEKIENIRYLMLDRKCEVAEQKPPSGLFARFKKKEENKTSNCWAEINPDGEIPDTLWNPKGAIKVIIHGFQPKFWTSKNKMIENHYIFDMGEEYGKLKDEHNIFGVDWTPFAATGSYPDAAFSTRTAGEETAKFLLNVHKEKNLAPEHWKKVHVIGFSLGSHVAGVTGFQLQKLGNVTPGRITGVGPAGPEFDTKEGLPIDKQSFLEKSDAEFVDILHCNMGIVKHWTLSVIKGRYESVYSAGHVDFYPNGGETQSNECNFLKDKSGCSHMVCMEYYINSIQKKDYLACRCKSWELFQKGKCPCKKDGKEGTLLGERVDKSAAGSYYLTIK